MTLPRRYLGTDLDSRVLGEEGAGGPRILDPKIGGDWGTQNPGPKEGGGWGPDSCILEEERLGSWASQSEQGLGCGFLGPWGVEGWEPRPLDLSGESG